MAQILDELGKKAARGSALREADVTMPPRVGPYRIERLIGMGGMGRVYEAFHEGLARPVALKRIRPERAGDPRKRAQMVEEARMAARLSHPNIVQIYDVLFESEEVWIVMELAPGPTLAQLAAGGPVGVQRVIDLAMDIARGLAAAHVFGIVHRDLKLENVKLTAGGQAKILDFGLAQLTRADRSHPSRQSAGRQAGTPRAMSPEQARGMSVDARSDLFALGSLLYELLAGDSPFEDTASHKSTLRRICTYLQAPLRSIDLRVPGNLSDLIDKLLEKDPNHRPRDAEEVVLALGRLRTRRAGPPSILFVDDEPDFEEVIRQAYKRKTKNKELFLRFARDGREAVDQLKKGNGIDLVITDLRMPNMDGLSLLKEIDKLGRPLPTVVVSAYGDMNNIRTAMNHGAFDFLIKPIDLEDLDKTLQKALSESERSQESRSLWRENSLLGELNQLAKESLWRHTKGADVESQGLAPGFGSDPFSSKTMAVLRVGILGFEGLPQRLSRSELSKALDDYFHALVKLCARFQAALFGYRHGEVRMVFTPRLGSSDEIGRASACARELGLHFGEILPLRLGIAVGRRSLREDDWTSFSEPALGDPGSPTPHNTPERDQD